MVLNPLTPEEERVIIRKGTEAPFSGKYNNHFQAGVYACRQCGAFLYRSADKFKSNCGWPSFDDEIEGAVKRVPDADGRRTEIVCATCDGHLGHVFTGERFTPKDTRHCVNSVSLQFTPEKDVAYGRAIFAGGCFWGVEYYLQKVPGVIETTVGYIGGKTDNPSYREVCEKTTGHAEAVEVLFDPRRTTFEALARVFFETHDPTQVDRQGPDVGDQYRSAVFTLDDEQKKVTEDLIRQLRAKGYDVATEVVEAGTFWKAEDYHQDYYVRKGSLPYCHGYTKRF
jgi:peptide methionine sulfoxide reductase msrA/msrB